MAGRPSKYRPEYAEQAEKLCKLGLIDEELAEFFEIAVATLNAWKKDYPEFLEALKNGKTLADAEVAAKLYQRATGYEHEAVQIDMYRGKAVVTKYVKHYPPDTVAGIYWLNNRQRARWKARIEDTGGDENEKLKGFRAVPYRKDG